MTIFEKIINKEIPAYIVYEDNDFLAFLDISQITKGHTLLIPKKPYKDIFEMPESLSKQLGLLLVKLSKSIKKTFNIDSVNIINNSGPLSGQEVFHLHFHIIPRYNKNDIKFIHENNFGKYSESEFFDIQSKIIKNI